MQNAINPKPFLLLLLLSAIIFLTSLYHREITFDDTFFAEQSYWLNKDGYVRSELFSTFKNWGKRQYIYLKLHIWQTALVEDIFGWSAYIFKTIPLVYLILFTFLAYRYFKSYLYYSGISSFYLFLSLLLINYYIVNFSFENRPEIAQMCLGFLSFLVLRNGLQSDKPAYLFLAGLLAGITVLLHFNGLIFIAAGAGLIVYKRRSRHLYLFLLAAAMIAPIYWYEMISNHAVEVALKQLAHYPSLAKGDLSIKMLALKVLFAPQRYFQHPFDAVYTLLLILSLYFNRHTIKENEEIKILLVYLVLAELTLAIIGPGSKAMYMVLYMPFVLFIIAVLNNNLFQRPLHKTMVIVFSLYYMIHIGHVVELIGDRNYGIIQQHARIINDYHIKKSDKIFAPAAFIFNEIGHAKISATETLSPGGILSIAGINNSQDIFNYAYHHNYQYLILRKRMLPDLSLSELIVGNVYTNYELIGHEFGYYIFHRL